MPDHSRWVLHANLATAFARMWLRDTAECEYLHLALHSAAARTPIKPQPYVDAESKTADAIVSGAG